MKDILIVEVEDSTVSALYPTYGNMVGDILMFNGYNTGKNSGFDLYMPNDLIVPSGAKSFMIDLGVRCQLKMGGAGGAGGASSGAGGNMHGYYLYPRSSLSKTPLRLCNSVGIIDYEYRGTIRVVVDNVSSEPFVVRKGDRLFQLCMPDLCPFTVEYGTVNRDTVRGEGGFGSTGK